VTNNTKNVITSPRDGAQTASSLVVRSEVPVGKRYGEYRNYLRRDFVFSCSYCTMSEFEAQAIRMTIDHYEPRKSRPDLENTYSNLMYACDECNLRKGDRCPPPEAREEGHRFFKADEDFRDEHFQRTGVRLNPKSLVGRYSILALDLNRISLCRLREIRERLYASERMASEGVLGLKRMRIDQLPPAIKGRAVTAIKRMEATQEKIAETIDAILADFARSDLIEADAEDNKRNLDRLNELRSVEAIYPNKWRAPKAKRR